MAFAAPILVHLHAAGGCARYWELNSPHGHDAFLKEFERLDSVLRQGIGATLPAFDRSGSNAAVAELAAG